MMSTQPSFTYLKLNTAPSFRYSVLTGSGISIIPSAIPQFNIYENTGAAPLFTWSGSTPTVYSGIYSWSFNLTGSLGFETGKTYNVVASSYMFLMPKFETIATFVVSQSSFVDLTGMVTTNYAADVSMIRGNFNTDEYTVQWRLNGVYLTGLTAPYLSLYKPDGTAHFLSRSMSVASGFATYDAVNAERIATGECYVAVTSGTFDGSVVKYSCPISRDYSV